MQFTMMKRPPTSLSMVVLVLVLVAGCSLGTGAQTQPSGATAAGATPIAVATAAPGSVGGAAPSASGTMSSATGPACRSRSTTDSTEKSPMVPCHTSIERCEGGEDCRGRDHLLFIGAICGSSGQAQRPLAS